MVEVKTGCGIKPVTDFENNILDIGDEVLVVYSFGKSGNELKRGIITDISTHHFTPGLITVNCDGCNTKVYGSKISKVIK